MQYKPDEIQCFIDDDGLHMRLLGQSLDGKEELRTRTFALSDKRVRSLIEELTTPAVVIDAIEDDIRNHQI